MNEQKRSSIAPELLIFFIIVAFTGFAMGMTDSVISNYFNDAYNVTTFQRGFLEFPRELPGLLCFLIIAMTSTVGDVRLAIVAQVLCIIGAVVLGLFTPPFAVMSFFIFVNSMGNHLYIPLQDSIGISVIGEEGLGKRMGQYGAIRTGFTMLATVIVFFGFRTGFFSFMTQIKLPFLIGAGGFLCVLALFVLLLTKYKAEGAKRKDQFQIIIRKEYKLYYILAILVGLHRQMVIVYGAWLLIRILNQGADNMALLVIIASFLGIFMLPVVGRWIDRYGPRRILLAEGGIFIVIYFVFGYMSWAFENGVLATVGLPLIIVCGLFVFDRLAMQMGMARTVYLRSIAVDPADITPTLSTGLSMDHVVSITFAFVGGIIWERLGAQYIFYGASVLSILNVVIALMIKPADKTAPANR